MSSAHKKPWIDTVNETYYVFWYDKVKRHVARLSLKTRDPAEAARKFSAFLIGGVDQYAPGQPAQAGLTVAMALDDYLREHVEAEGTKVVDAERIRFAIKNLKVGLGPVALRDMTKLTSQEYARRRRSGELGRKAQDGTIRRELVTLVAAINHAKACKRITPADVPPIDLPPHPEAKTRWLTRDELAKLFAAAKGRLRDWMEIAYYTAARRDAVLHLKWDQVDMVQQRIRLNPEGRRQTKKRRPTIPIDPLLFPTLQRLWRENEAAEIKSEYVLGPPWLIRKGFEGACKRAGIKGATPHTLRHTRATHLLQSGVDIWSVAGLLGDTIATVEATYGHHSCDHLRDVLGKPKAVVPAG